MTYLRRIVGRVSGLVVATTALLPTSAMAEVVRMTINGRIASVGASDASGGAFAGLTGPFTASFEYDTSDTRWFNGSYHYGMDQINYYIPKVGSISLDGKTYGASPFYYNLSYSSLDLSRTQGRAGMGMSFNFVQPDSGKSYYSNFDVYGSADDFFVDGKSKLLVAGSTISQFTGSFTTGWSAGYFGDFGIVNPGNETFVRYIPELITISAVPEPATWAMMIVGFGMVGATARYRRRSSKATYA